MNKKEVLTNLTDLNLISQYFSDRWLAFVYGKSTGQCETCHGCCRSDYIIGLSKKEAQEIPHTLVDGHAAIIPDENGVCPFLVDNACSIYEKRPQSCRQFDCRDLAFAGLLVHEDDGNAGAKEMNESIERHIRNNGQAIFFPMRKKAVEILETIEDNAVKAAQGALLIGMHNLMPPEKFLQLVQIFTADDEQERATAQTVAVEHRARK